MVRTVDVDMDVTCKRFETALNRFFKKYQNLEEEWRETFEWMYESGVDFLCDNLYADGTKNKDWCYALHLDAFDSGHFYLAVIQRQEA